MPEEMVELAGLWRLAADGHPLDQAVATRATTLAAGIVADASRPAP
jgi:hypothetical protein